MEATTFVPFSFFQTVLGVQNEQNIHAGIHDLMTSITAHDVTSNVTLRMADAVYYDAQRAVVMDRQDRWVDGWMEDRGIKE